MDRQTLQNYEMHDYYAYLNLKCNASSSDIKHSYRQLALLWHPDKHPEEDARVQATKVFHNISAAYETLIDASQRKTYDVVWRRRFQGRSQVPHWAVSCGGDTPDWDSLSRHFAQFYVVDSRETTLASGTDSSNRGTECHQCGQGMPPICSELILQDSEARFMIKFDSLVDFKVEHRDLSQNNLDLLGPSGKTLLSANMFRTPNKDYCLSLARAGYDEDPCACIFAPADQLLEDKPIFELVGKLGRLYGHLECRSRCEVLLRHDTHGPVLLIEANDEEFRVVASANAGHRVASASKSTALLSPGDLLESQVWKVQVKPGYDAVLIISAMLAQLALNTR